jgi:hypothetical protein
VPGAADKAPFYAIRIHTGDLGSARGLVTNAEANVLDRSGAPIPGLYAAGNDMNSLMNGTYPGPGITLGPAHLRLARRQPHRRAPAGAGHPTENLHVLRTENLHPRPAENGRLAGPVPKPRAGVQSEHLGNLVGFFTTEFGEVNQVVHIWGYASLDERMAAARHGGRPALGGVLAAQPRAGRVLRLQSRLLRPTGFSPLQ